MNNFHTFEHVAMKTTFALRLDQDDRALCEKVAHASMERINNIERQLSRYIQGSDIWQINHMASGQSLFIGEDCYKCLQLSLQASIDTFGLFDATIGKRIEHIKNNGKKQLPLLVGQLLIDPKRPIVHCSNAGREVDLGGIAKGYALDQVKQLCIDWDIQSGLLSAGSSTHLAIGKRSWPITIKKHEHNKIIRIKDEALSVSGKTIQNSHIVSPISAGNTNYNYDQIRVVHKSAATADAYSTAALLMNDEQLLKLNKNATIITE